MNSHNTTASAKQGSVNICCLSFDDESFLLRGDSWVNRERFWRTPRSRQVCLQCLCGRACTPMSFLFPMGYCSISSYGLPLGVSLPHRQIILPQISSLHLSISHLLCPSFDFSHQCHKHTSLVVFLNFFIF